MLEGRGKVWKASSRGGHTVYIPADIVKDSAYPFNPHDRVHVRLDPKTKMVTITLEEGGKTFNKKGRKGDE